VARKSSLDRARNELVWHIERLAHGTDDVMRLVRDVGRELRKVVRFDFDACWFTIDPTTLLITGHFNAHLENDEDLRRTVNLSLAINEYQETDFNKFADLAGQRVPADTLHRSTNGDLERSARYRTILKPIGAAAELRVAFREGDSCWAGLALYRIIGEPDFSDADIDLVLSSSAAISAGVRRALTFRDLQAADPETAPGLVLFNERGELEATTPAAERWLDQLFDPASTTSGGIPHVVYAVATRSRGAPGAGVGVRTRVPTRSGGWLVLHASLLKDGKRRRTAVIIEPAKLAEVLPLRLQGYRLTAREVEVVDLVLEGRSTKEIADALLIAPYTVGDHLKSVFDKVGVNSRRQLVSHLAAPDLG
jgi:DNA-binding CsgD family transcriptional regulator